jgi:biotin-dependent carboxylase-like uncharacterized protein
VTITVLEPGPLSSIQDPVGRPGWRRYGVPVGGAADAWSARLANRLVGNPEQAALIEITIGGAGLEFERTSLVALTGGLSGMLDGRPLPATTAVDVPSGSVVRVEPGDGARGYLAVAGGIEVDPILGSGSTDLRSGFGGSEGRALAAGDVLRLGPAADPRRLAWRGSREDGPIRLVAGPHGPGLDEMCAVAWSVGVAADRAGVRLDGPSIAVAPSEVPSMGLPLGAVQVPPDGRPIAMLVDRPVTGGYPVPAVVIRADVGRVAQLLTGDEVRFASVTMDDALRAWVDAEASLAALEPAG